MKDENKNARYKQKAKQITHSWQMIVTTDEGASERAHLLIDNVDLQCFRRVYIT